MEQESQCLTLLETTVTCERGSTIMALSTRHGVLIADQGADDHDHLITPEERPYVAMVRQ